MAKKGGTTVTPPDPVATAQAQTQSNIETARANQVLNMINTQDPNGTVRFEADPTAPGGYRMVTTLSPEQQQLQSQTWQIGNDQLGRVGQALATPLSAAGLPGMVSSVDGGPIASSFDRGQALRYGFDPGGQVQTSVGGDLDQARQQAIDAVYGQVTSRLDPQWSRDQASLETRLANQGLSMNDTAWQSAQDQFGRAKNDAYNQAAWSSVAAGEDQANALYGRQLSQGQFGNQAVAQQYGQNQGLAAFHNATAGQDYGQNQGLAAFQNTAQQQTFEQALANANLTNNARAAGLQERAYLQNQPINQLAALLSGSQVSMPGGVGYTPAQQANTDVLGAYALNAQVQQANAQRQAQSQSGLMGGLFSLGSAAILASDVRLKRDVRKVGARPDGIGIYEYAYRGRPGRHRGYLAQDVERVRPEAVVTRPDGYKAVNYGLLA